MTGLFIIVALYALFIQRMWYRNRRAAKIILFVGLLPVTLGVLFLLVTAIISHQIDDNHFPKTTIGNPFSGTRCTEHWNPDCCLRVQRPAFSYIHDECSASRRALRNQGGML